MRNKNLLLRLLLFVFSCLCLPQMLLQAQSNQGSTDSLLSISSDSVKSRLIQLPYSAVPAHLTAASTDVVYRKDLVKSPVTNVLNALTGRLSGIYTEQFSGQPGSDGVNLSLRGRTPVVLIDGVVRNLTTLDLEEIESVTVLKDALATAMLGVRGANGAVLITTRKGSATNRSISFTVQSGIQQPLGLPKTLGAYDFARLRNEAVNNELKVRQPNDTALKRLLYTDADLQAYQNGTDPFGHPDVNWQSQLLKKTSMINRYSFNATGGNNFSRFFVALEHLNQDGLFKENSANVYPTNNWLKSYLARTNIDLNITPKLSAGISLLGRIINSNEPGGTVGNIFSGIINTPNNAYPVYNQNGSFGGNTDYQVTNLNLPATQQSGNLQGLATNSGYRQSYRRDILADFNLKRTLDEITPGLWVKARLSYSSNLTENFTRTKVFVAYKANGAAYDPIGLVNDQINTNNLASQGRSNYAEGSLGYQKTFNQMHGLDVLVMYNQDNMITGSELPYSISGTSGRIAYNYKQKYVAEVAVGYNGSNRYPSNGSTRRGFFPAFGLTWNISQEDFAKDMTWMSNVKLYASYGKSGWDNPGYFSYMQTYNNTAQVFFGTAAGAQNSLSQFFLAYPGITWEKANKFNVGVQGNLLSNRLGFTVEYYNNKFYDLFAQRGRNTSLLGITYPNENIGQARYTGMDFNLSWQESKGSFTYFIAANASIQKSELLYFDEPIWPNDYNRRTGQTLGRPFGYVADGLFMTDAEAASSPTVSGYKAQAGDIKYKDLNNDGVINLLDQTAIGTDKPLTTYGVNLGFNWKGFDFSALLQGVANRNRYITQFGFQNGGLGQAYEANLDRWTPSNTSATNPRLGIGVNANNQAFSSFYMSKGDYLRLKSFEIGYTLPSRLTGKAKFSAVRLFANGFNLLTKNGSKGHGSRSIWHLSYTTCH